MMDYRNVIVLQDARAVRDNLAQELARRDFAVRSCGSLAGLRHLYATQPSPLIVLTGESDDLACDAQSARMAAPGAVIIALGTAADAGWRKHVMAAGADACHAASIDIAELTAILLSWGRQAARGGGVESAGLESCGVEPCCVEARGGVPCCVESSNVEPCGFEPLGLASPGVASPGLESAGLESLGLESFGEAAGRQLRRPVDHMQSAPRAGPARAQLAAQSSQAGVSSRLQHVTTPAYPSGRVGSGWSLDANCRVLICPQDRTLFMTAAENSFLMRIAASEGQLLRRRPPAAPRLDRAGRRASPAGPGSPQYGRAGVAPATQGSARRHRTALAGGSGLRLSVRRAAGSEPITHCSAWHGAARADNAAGGAKLSSPSRVPRARLRGTAACRVTLRRLRASDSSVAPFA